MKIKLKEKRKTTNLLPEMNTTNYRTVAEEKKIENKL